MKSLGRFMTAVAALIVAQNASAAIAAKVDGEKTVTLTGEEIAALPRKNVALKLPFEGMYLVSGWYGVIGKLAWSGGLTNTEWSPERPTLSEGPAQLKAANQGNAVQSWRHGTNLVNEAKIAKAAGMSLMSLCGGGTPEDAAAVRAASDFVAYDMHESFTFELYDDEMNMYKATDEEILRKYTLRKSANDLVRKIRGRTDRLHEIGWGTLTSSAASFNLDYLVLGGLDVPGLEFYPFADTLLGAALCRGMTRQYGANGWHAYLAHEWYSYLPHTNPRKMESLRTMLQMQYMNGAKLVTLESGNLYLQSNLCVDSPQGFLPPVGKHIINGSFDREQDKLVTADDIREAKRKFSWIDDRSPVVQKYRRIMSDFWDFVKTNPQPAGQPEATVALVKGNFDLGGELASANTPVAGAFNIAKIDHHWMCGEPERSWHVATDVFFPKPATLLPNRNLVYGATPYGLMDIVSFAFDNVTAEYLIRNYKLLILTGWNTCSPKQYKVLCDYVKGGGKLCLSIAHLSTNERRNYDFFTKDELVNGGDFSELCGIKVTGQGDRFYWATGTSRTKNCLGLVARRRYGIMGMPLGKIEYTQPEENYETLAADDEQFRPVIIRAKKGKGEVYFLNIWSYPAEANRDTGTGATEGSLGLVGELYAYLARTSRGNVWITGPDFERPDADCGYIAYSYFPSAGKIFLLNLDYEHERKCVMHWFGEKDFLALKPAEFRVIEAPKLDPDEQLNASTDGFNPREQVEKLNEDWWAKRHAAILKQIKESNGEFDLVFLGDSITHYWDVGEGTDTSTEIEDLRKKYTILSAGFGGDWCQNLLWRINHGELDGYKAKLVMLMIGTNNNKDSAEQIFARIREIVKVVRKKQPQAKLLLLPIFPRFSGRDTRLEKTNELLFAADFGEGVILHSFNDKMLDGDGKLRQELFEDGLHPSAKGYSLWRQEVEPIFQQVVGR